MSYEEIELLNVAINLSSQDTVNVITLFENDESISEIRFNPDNPDQFSYITFGPGGEFIDCFRTALYACLQDPECAFLCGILWRQCIAAIAAACAYHTIVNPGS